MHRLLARHLIGVAGAQPRPLPTLELVERECEADHVGTAGRCCNGHLVILTREQAQNGSLPGGGPCCLDRRLEDLLSARRRHERRPGFAARALAERGPLLLPDEAAHAATRA